MEAKDKEAQLYIDAIEAAGFRPRSYSGRFMYGKQCLAVALNSPSDLFGIGMEVGSQHPEGWNPDRELRTDSLGSGIIAYWPDIDLPEGFRDEDDEDEDE